MDASCKKMYGVHEADAKTHYDHYFSLHVQYSIFKETTINMIQSFYKAFRTGMVTGRTVVDFCIGPIIFHLLAIKDFVEEITVLELNETSLKELVDWKNKEPGTVDSSHTTEIIKELKGISDECEEEEEENLRQKIVNIFKWNLDKEHPADALPLLKADIAISVWGLEVISKDHEDYRRNLRKYSTLVKLGGYLLMYVDINASYFTVGEDKFHYLRCDESFYRKVIQEEGFEIKHWEKFDRVMCTDLLDHEAVVFIVAHKVKEL